MTDLQTKLVPVSSLTPDPENVRTHDSKNLDAIKRSLELFGQRKPIVTAKANDGSLVVIAGNGTLEAAKALGWSKIAIVQVPEDWDADKAKAYAIADNRTAELADWNHTALTQALVDLDAVGYGVKDLGFDPATLDDADDVIQDDVPALPTEPTRTAPGQLWQLGDHRLLVGDSTNADDFNRLMAGKLANCIFTDPPYNVAYQGGTADALTIQNDNMSDEEFNRFLFDAYTRMFDATAPGGAIYVAYPGEHISSGAFGRQLTSAGWLLKQVLIWVKDNFVLSRQDYHWQHEAILYGWKPGAAHSWYGKRIRTTVLENEKDLASLKKSELLELLLAIAEASSIIHVDRPRRNAEHPTMKPIPLVARLVANSTERGHLVLDPFGGSGSTLIACEQMARTCYTIEKDPRYADVILNRWEALTGQEATLA